MVIQSRPEVGQSIRGASVRGVSIGSHRRGFFGTTVAALLSSPFAMTIEPTDVVEFDGKKIDTTPIAPNFGSSTGSVFFHPETGREIVIDEEDRFFEVSGSSYTLIDSPWRGDDDDEKWSIL